MVRPFRRADLHRRAEVPLVADPVAAGRRGIGGGPFDKSSFLAHQREGRITPHYHHFDFATRVIGGSYHHLLFTNRRPLSTTAKELLAARDVALDALGDLPSTAESGQVPEFARCWL